MAPHKDWRGGLEVGRKDSLWSIPRQGAGGPCDQGAHRLARHLPRGKAAVKGEKPERQKEVRQRENKG